MKTFSLLTLLIAFVLIGSCKKDSKTPVSSAQLQGNYTGRVVVNDNGKSTVINSAVKMQINGVEYNAETNSNNPSPSQGTFTLNNSQVVFADSLEYLAIYDMSFLLSGRFSAQIKADSLILTKGDNSYSYRFVKQ